MHVVGARPNFVKMAPVVEALDRSAAFDQFIVHTGQHYDARMSEDVLADLDFPVPDRFLGVGSGTHGEQTAKVLSGFEQVLFEVQPRAVLVAGDVNSTLACALVAGPAAMRLLYGDAFVATRTDLALLALGIGGFLAACTFCQALLARGQGGRAAALWTVSAVTFVVLQLSLDGSEFHRVSVAFMAASTLIALLLMVAVWRERA